MLKQSPQLTPQRSLHQLRIQLGSTDALPQLTLLGLLIGLLAGGLLIAFREAITLTSSLWLLSNEDHFELLSGFERFVMPVLGALAILALFACFPIKRRSVGILHVVERLDFHRGRMSISSAVMQFFGAIIAIACGFSVGREGPAVHLGAATGSILGQRMRLPQNTLRILAACGAAAAISASFNTPMAGVIFAMEVVVRRYAINSFIPVIAAAVTAAVLSQMMYGPDPAFIVPVIPMTSLTELGVAAASASLIGLLAAAFIHLQVWTAKHKTVLPVHPLILAGITMGTTGYFFPEVMGIGYDSIELILTGELLNITLLLSLLVVKLSITAVITGLGIPGGIIGPSLMIGALAGSAFGLLGDAFLNLPDISNAFHALLGMVAMMAAVLQAPLAALITVLELTRNPHIIMPAMFAIVIACLIAGRLTSRGGLVDMQLQARGYNLTLAPVRELLDEQCVASLMSGISNETELPANHYHIPVHASLSDALETMDQHGVDLLGVYSAGRTKEILCGVVTRTDIQEFCQ